MPEIQHKTGTQSATPIFLSTPKEVQTSQVDVEASPQTQEPEISLTQQNLQDEAPHTILTERQKIFTIIIASFAAFISPVSASIYYPALNSLAEDLHVTVSTINLTSMNFLSKSLPFSREVFLDFASFPLFGPPLT